MPTLSNKPLYIAKSLEELTKKAEEKLPAINTSNVRNLITSSLKLYEEGKKSMSSGDEERTYILFFRFFESIKFIKTLNAYKSDEKYFSNLIGMNKLTEVLKSLEELNISLAQRYSLLQKSNQLRAEEIANANEKPNNTNNYVLNNTNKSIESNDTSYQTIDCLAFNELLENSTEITKILILDTRSTEEYKESHIDKLKSTADVTIANIPQHLLTPGLTVNKLEQILPLGNSRDAINRRRQMNKIVILDKHSEMFVENTPAFHLAEALWKWDYTSLKMKNKPLLLKGGYSEWEITYPMYSSNPFSISKSTQFTLNTKKTDLKCDYDLNDENEHKIVKNNHLVNGITNGITGDEADKSATNTEQSTPTVLNNIFHPRPTNTAIPGTALPVIPDRSMKPKIINETKTTENGNEVKDKDFEKFRLKKQNEATEQMLDTIRENYEKSIEDMKLQYELKDKENIKLKTTLRNLLPEKPTNLNENQKITEKPVITINGDINGFDKRNGIYITERGDEDKENNENELTTINDISKNSELNNESLNKTITTTPKSSVKPITNLSVNSNLSRSLSSPNIAQLLAKEEDQQIIFERNDLKNNSFSYPPQPQFDRTLKPSLNTEKSNFHEFSVVNDNKLRDFCPVHSAGQSITGLKNLGNTCFMNAVIQCFLNTPDFAKFFSGKFHINKNSKFGTNGELVLELAALFRTMAFPSSYKSISPKDFKLAVSKHIRGFIGCNQQDSHEFMVKLLEKLHEDLNESNARDVIETSVPQDLSLNAAANKFWKDHIHKNQSIITELFEGLIVNTLRCLTCLKTSNTFEPFSCLSLPLSNYRTTLNDCLNQYFKTERLCGETAWECPTCKQKREADKKVAIWKMPKVLIVHLKRFSYEGVLRQKLQTYVEFPIDDLIVPTLNQNGLRYTLYGVVNHYGTLEGGHYTAYSQNPNKYKWHRFDDQEITQINTADVKTQAAYILFYKCS